MPINVKCPGCGKQLQVPDGLAGKPCRCPSCGTVMTAPEEVFEAEAVARPEPEPGRRPEPEPGPREDPGGIRRGEDVYGVREEPAPGPGGPEERTPCPMCGELIMPNAAMCRFCGEVFDETLRRAEQKKKGGTDADMTTGDWLLAILCSGIGCIFGIVWMIQGKPKGGKMLGVSFLFAIFWNIVRFAVEASMRQH
jgi:hypothetical protein